MASIRKFVEDFHALGKKLNVLVNNAGLFLKSDDRVRQFTKDNFELTMGTNHLGKSLTPDLGISLLPVVNVDISLPGKFTVFN